MDTKPKLPPGAIGLCANCKKPFSDRKVWTDHELTCRVNRSGLPVWLFSSMPRAHDLNWYDRNFKDGDYY